ncbi:hypothetical protein RDI58_000537 [Solanum bulbocastanum]|uniref:Uncharacterized protein n=1 Tax=Solanum bulbocastanum TaxID=147425 RepID=A0AAN8YP76_SOLBU
MGFSIVVVDVDGASGTREDQVAQKKPNVSTRATQSLFIAQDEPNKSTGAAQSSFRIQKGKIHQSQKQSNNFKASSSKVNENDRCNKRKITEDKNEIVLKDLMKVMKQFTESHDKRMTSLIDKLGERDLYEICGKIFSIIEIHAYEIYNSNEQVKAAMRITQDIKRKEFFLSKVDPYAKSMNFKKWLLFTNCEEIFRKNGATGQFTKGSEDGVKEIERTKAQEVANDMSL